MSTPVDSKKRKAIPDIASSNQVLREHVSISSSGTDPAEQIPRAEPLNPSISRDEGRKKRFCCCLFW